MLIACASAAWSRSEPRKSAQLAVHVAVPSSQCAVHHVRRCCTVCVRCISVVSRLQVSIKEANLTLLGDGEDGGEEDDGLMHMPMPD